MSRERRSYEQKALSERQDYIKNTIRRTPEPTIDELAFDADSTAAEAPPTATGHRSYTPTRRPPSSISLYIKDHGPAILIGAASIVLIPLLGWVLYTMFILNREVGEMRIRLDESHQQAERLEKQLDRINDRLDSIAARKEADKAK